MGEGDGKTDCVGGWRLVLLANGDKLDNRKANLRSCTKAQNSHNSKSHRDNKYSSAKGVSFDKKRGKWTADIMSCGKRFRLGRFSTESEAAEAYRRSAILLHKEFANDRSYLS